MSTISKRRPLVVGNWKMNGLRDAAREAREVRAGIAGTAVDAMICPPATLIAAFADVAKGSALAIGAQDCHAAPAGAHTGDMAAEMLADAGASAVILGHSERRSDHGERDRDVRAKVAAAERAGLRAIVCVGETAGERGAELTLAVVGRQLAGSLPDQVPSSGLVVAYEPVWAIGTGVTPTPEDASAVHGFIRKTLAKRYGEPGREIPILYGGSVKPGNAGALLNAPDIDGALVGGASLKASEFLAIIGASCRPRIA